MKISPMYPKFDDKEGWKKIIQPERSKREDYPNGSLWQDSSTWNKEDETYVFYGRLEDKWVNLGRFKHFTEVNWDRCGALNTQETE